MNKKMYNLELLDNTYGLSCIENYFIYSMREIKYQYIPLFFMSYIKFEDVIKEFVENGSKYASFYKIPRLHKLAAEYGLLDIVYKKEKEINLLNKKQYEYTAIQVKSSFISEKYLRSLWRNDHFILVKREEKEFYYLNDTPKDTGIITHKKINEIFDGKVIRFSIKEKINDILRKEFEQSFKISLKNENLKQSKNILIYEIPNISMARDIIGILRVSRKRICQFLECIGAKKGIFLKYLNVLDMAYNKIEYMRLRNLDEHQEYSKILYDIYRKDIEFLSIIQKYI